MPSCGPSPRGRGNRSYPRSHRRSPRSIPAWAGKPPHRGHSSLPFTVHPRVGGETPEIEILEGLVSGPSPRGRGNHSLAIGRAPHPGSIPAWAGKPRLRVRLAGRHEVHPRVGGETDVQTRDAKIQAGPSPRGRGNLCHRAHRGSSARSIPAWAGKPDWEASSVAAYMVHPRVGGETRRSPVTPLSSRGPSPRGRGNRGPHVDLPVAVGSIPAWAGKPTSEAPPHECPKVHPRVGGETVTEPATALTHTGPSPRGRGNPSSGPPTSPVLRSIPAWAGKPATVVRDGAGIEVHPRVGGETSRLCLRS